MTPDIFKQLGPYERPESGAHKMFYRFRSTTAFVISSTKVGIGSTGSMSTIFRSNPELALSN